ncbi:hypothetical protein AtNW77_Chr2g0229211 [Arabidopsis thaliana]
MMEDGRREFNVPMNCPIPVVKRRMKAPKHVDEDLFKIFPQATTYLRQIQKRGGSGCFEFIRGEVCTKDLSQNNTFYFIF